MKRKHRRLALPVTVLTIGALIGACSAYGEDEELRQARARVVPDGDGGYCTGESGWDGNYNYCTNNCHHAANYGVQGGNDGIISCDGCPNGRIGGHAVNYDSVPCGPGTSGSCQGYCISDPQSADDTPACCWEQPNGGSVDVASGPGSDCASKICRRDGGAVAFDAGEQWDAAVYACGRGTTTRSQCQECCHRNRANQIGWCDNPPDPECTSEVIGAWHACLRSCKEQYDSP